jgi:hypothetical protein
MYCISCNDTAKQSENVPDKVDTAVHDTGIATTPIPLDGCYRMIANADTVIMRLNVIDSLVSGELSYRLAGKDRNDGSLKGVVRDSLIIADYTFRSEGTMSVRQVAFRMAGTLLVEGHGELDTKGDTMRFKDVRNLKFQYDRPMSKVPCIE